MHSGEFLAAKTFLMATIFTILAYERRDKIARKYLARIFHSSQHIEIGSKSGNPVLIL